MLPNQVLNAIPRQKVKHCMTGDIGSVLALDEIRVVVLAGNPVYVGDWRIEDCEPVPEEPMPLRVGDAACIQGTFCRITAVNDGSYRTTAGMGWVHEADGSIRHATPQECKDYFLND